ncbi:addiction module protein [Longimicrobium terrae]|uniref:Glycerol-3-phosphate dehydrogenase n=1 Tax=Longimicrobium terrae TaxID=1639882 RepID=A0A841H0R5_9BACT|nr:addiction module protein [Longimicrobium terrae]MBB4637220.1 glycerol-3-phosphate dehydrogenase [Longimicrobium terrae]MBB6071519.1 glycerol-3-phosphate dehydrogenase [Longimicrobium terrae]NNC30059.1 hypothetical protein [Longimicrobium terrae]
MNLSPQQVQDEALAMSPGHRLHLMLILSASLDDEEDDELLDDPEWPAELARHIARAEAEMAEARAAAMADAAQSDQAASGDAETEEALEAERAWAEEIRTRVDDYRSGRVQLVPSDEVFTRLRDQLT